jgi:ABC transporter substrate binding protein
MENAIQELMPQIDLLVVWGTMGGLAAKKLVRTLPVIFVAVAAPNLALTYGLPSCYAFRETVQAGGLVSLGPDRVWMAKQAADYKIIRGAKPEKLPIQQPDRYELHVNLTTAKLLGLEIPDTLLARADEVIE